MRCDGLVVATPAGSTGYNLANGGPVLAWGVEGFVVSFIAPHTLTARALVVAPGDTLEVAQPLAREERRGDRRTGGRSARWRPRRRSRIRFSHRQSLLAQTPGASFYHRLRDKFGTPERNWSVTTRPVRRALADIPWRVLLELRVENLLLIERAELRLGPA